MSTENTKVATGKVLFSYAHVFEPKAFANSTGKPKYMVSILIKKDDEFTLKKVKAAINGALLNGKADKFGGKIPTSFKNPVLRDGDTEDSKMNDPVYKGHFFITAKSNEPPMVLDKNKNEILDRTEFYSGCYGRAVINFYAYNENGNKGVAAGLNAVMKLSDGNKLSGNTVSPDDFDDDFVDTEIDDSLF